MNQPTVCAGLPADESMLSLIENKNEKGYSLLYQRYWGRLVNYTYTIVGEKYIAEEIVQSLFVSFYTHPVSIKNKVNLSPYLYQSVRNRVKNYYRTQHNYKKHVNARPPEYVLSTNCMTSTLDVLDLQNEIRRCLSQLPWKYHEVFLLSKEHQLTIKEIAEQLRRPPGTVEKHLRKAMDFLKANLDTDLFRTI